MDVINPPKRRRRPVRPAPTQPDPARFIAGLARVIDYLERQERERAQGS